MVRSGPGNTMCGTMPGRRRTATAVEACNVVVVAYSRLLQDPLLEINKARLKARHKLKLEVPSWTLCALAFPRTKALEICCSRQQ